MRVASFAGMKCLSRLEVALGATETLVPVATVEDLGRELDEGRADVAVIDIDACSHADIHLLTTLVSRHGPAIIAYGAVAPALVHAVVTLAPHGLTQVMCRGVDDIPSCIRRSVHDAAAKRVSSEIVGRLSLMLSRASIQVRDAVAQLFSDPLGFRCVADVAQVAGITRRSLDRTLFTLELEPARMFLLAARVTWAYPRIRAAHTTVSNVARQLGVSKPERFAQHTRLLLGLTPSEVRTEVSPAKFSQLIVARLRRQPRPRVTDVAYEPRWGRVTLPASVPPTAASLPRSGAPT